MDNTHKNTSKLLGKGELLGKKGHNGAYDNSFPEHSDPAEWAKYPSLQKILPKKDCLDCHEHSKRLKYKP